ncbi:MAG: hypothetical protein FWD71_01405 [Oscillospiraceae bacterium]|nr:hypothetical protein [Oscillospiraceae bacterium]
MEANMAKVDAQAKRFVTLAKKYGVEKNFLFTTTFEHYLMQLNILNDLKKVIENEGILVTKEYVKGRENIYVHPAVAEYHKAADGCNKTASLLMNIVLKMKSDDKKDKNNIEKFLDEFKKNKKRAGDTDELS